ncbi:MULTISPECIES: hypothetical protein [unclassified Streptomyces]|uniref:hypothetical protein n=1 Tax=unclassified Streptomyces TaxID=2593676 RepID=UPI0021563EAE|nr:hypothetical protein [Streptomyces sp. SM10]
MIRSTVYPRVRITLSGSGDSVPGAPARSADMVMVSSVSGPGRVEPPEPGSSR